MNAWQRMAVIGDSIASGVREPVDGYEDLSWIDRMTRALGTETLNLGERDLRAREVRERQLSPALDFRPDLAVVVCGGNDAFSRRFDAVALEAELDHMVGAFRAAGADVVTLGLFDIVRSGLVSDATFIEEFQPRLRLLHDVTERVSAAHGAVFADFSAHPAGADPSIYSSDLIHLNARGHAIAAVEVLALLEHHAALT
ncbi:SGNH/GDSL hydrolase family protein [Actinocorallia sp. A-T 12471]|uniref:SGNH/GDSL hydrolase family protein n=1 Tax=Actinocorallia sp. A-T 12471 TaxID=3089813 RepID=UPI0029D403FC|nr:SGNH/GDSL hydrolase family protein [Actinocorallia sp. A-T 12471]MDX6744847.1 SGNH/GDSL hydrolase family protein [Actinocorallia sp. A-T 12471]